MKTQYYTASSLDGFIAAPDDDLSWLFQFAPPEELGYDAFIADVGAIAMGSHTYEWILKHLVEGEAPPDPGSGRPAASDPPESAPPASAPPSSSSSSSELPLPTGQPQPWPYIQPTWVFTSRDLPRIPGADIRFVRGDVRPVHRAMHRAMREAIGGPESAKNIWIAGGGDLVGQFHDAGLMDELIIQVASVTLGAGAPLLPRRIVTPPLRLISANAFAEGFVELRYEIR
jgi:dihydrofolate reductase